MIPSLNQLLSNKQNRFYNTPYYKLDNSLGFSKNPSNLRAMKVILKYANPLDRGAEFTVTRNRFADDYQTTRNSNKKITPEWVSKLYRRLEAEDLIEIKLTRDQDDPFRTINIMKLTNKTLSILDSQPTDLLDPELEFSRYSSSKSGERLANQDLLGFSSDFSDVPSLEEQNQILNDLMYVPKVLQTPKLDAATQARMDSEILSDLTFNSPFIEPDQETYIEKEPSFKGKNQAPKPKPKPKPVPKSKADHEKRMEMAAALLPLIVNGIKMNKPWAEIQSFLYRSMQKYGCDKVEDYLMNFYPQKQWTWSEALERTITKGIKNLDNTKVETQKAQERQKQEHEQWEKVGRFQEANKYAWWDYIASLRAAEPTEKPTMDCPEDLLEEFSLCEAQYKEKLKKDKHWDEVGRPNLIAWNVYIQHLEHGIPTKKPELDCPDDLLFEYKQVKDKECAALDTVV